MHEQRRGIPQAQIYWSPVAKRKKSQWECHSLHSLRIRDGHVGDELGEASGVNTCGWKERGEKGKGQAKGKLNGDVLVGTA